MKYLKYLICSFLEILDQTKYMLFIIPVIELIHSILIIHPIGIIHSILSIIIFIVIFSIIYEDIIGKFRGNVGDCPLKLITENREVIKCTKFVSFMFFTGLLIVLSQLHTYYYIINN